MNTDKIDPDEMPAEWQSWMCTNPHHAHYPHPTSGDEKARNLANREARYQEHLSLGPKRCGCNTCQRKRAVHPD